MNAANIKEIRGKTITEARFWPDDEREMYLQLKFTDGTMFGLNVPQPQVTFDVTFYKDDLGEGKNLTTKLIKRASK